MTSLQFPYPGPVWALGAALLSFASPAVAKYSEDDLAELQAQVQQLRQQVRVLEGYQPAPVEVPPTVDPLTAGWDRGFYLASADDNYRLHIGGWLQPRYEYQDRSDRDPAATSSFFLRRLRLDIRGHVFTPDLTFRIMTEHARTSNLRDGWINYAFGPALQVRFGQFTVPFQWHRFVGPRRQHFAERGVPSETFGWFQGRDVGVMTHGRLFDDNVVYGIGLFDGAGRNVATSNSDGHMATGRVTWALLGSVPREESDYAWSTEPQLSIGAGVQGAWENEVRAWDLGRSPVGNERADWITATLDARFAWRGFSLVGDVYHRHVAPDDPAVAAYDGWAYMISAGYFVLPERQEVVGRYSQLRLDRNDADTREREWGVGWNLYHRGHDWKTRLNLLRHDFADAHDHRFLVEHHLQF